MNVNLSSFSKIKPVLVDWKRYQIKLLTVWSLLAGQINNIGGFHTAKNCKGTILISMFTFLHLIRLDNFGSVGHIKAFTSLKCKGYVDLRPVISNQSLPSNQRSMAQILCCEISILTCPLQSYPWHKFHLRTSNIKTLSLTGRWMENLDRYPNHVTYRTTLIIGWHSTWPLPITFMHCGGKKWVSMLLCELMHYDTLTWYMKQINIRAWW